VSEPLKPLYPGLYGWKTAYQLPDGSVTICSCFREAWYRYFIYLREELPGSYLRTHKKTVEGKRLLKLAFSRFGSSMHPAALKAFFPTSEVSADKQQVIGGRDFFFGIHRVTPPDLDEGFWETPQKVFHFENGICDVCTGRVPRHYYCHQMYGSPFAQVYGAWVRADLIRQGYVDWLNRVDKTSQRKLWNEAENKMRRTVGVPQIGERFISETVLYKTVAYLLKGREVIHHHRADWLGRQELDIFVPALSLAIEYQGEQHFIPIGAWGGEEALAKTQQRDEEKRRRCEGKGVRLLYFDHTMELSERFVARQLEQILPKGES
jgi:hypothetical protein